ncbi:MAG TPA: zinc-binding dehydrogenase [Acidimicrobiales bacterium]|jgi:NADPH:quinone reductase-like Zn-dependent oxidoreductase
MRANVIRDNELHWEDHDDPVPGDTELLVAVRAAGINSADLVQRMGFYPAPPGWPSDIPGMEMAGEVVAVGREVTLFAPGDRVMALVGGGAQAELAFVDEMHALAVPDGLDWPEAGGFTEAFVTAYDAMFTQAALQMGERVLISGAAGGVGTAGVQLAAAAGARVTATVRNPDHHDAVRELGADVVIAPGEEGQHGPYDVVLELVGQASLSGVLPYLAPWSRVVVIGVGSGGRMEIDLMQLMTQRIRIGGTTLRSRTRQEKADVVAGVRARVLPWLAAGRLRVPVADTFQLAEAGAAYERFAAGGKLGKVVLVA